MRYAAAIAAFVVSMSVWWLGGVDFDQRGFVQAYLTACSLFFAYIIWMAGGIK
jgi:hypothetical protein